MTRRILWCAAALGFAACTGSERSNPLLAAAQVDEVVAGSVEERLEAGSYVYLRVREPSGAERWVASLSATPARRVSVHVFARAARFESARTGRTFSPLSFGSVTAIPESTK